MNTRFYLLTFFLVIAMSGRAATINWSASTDNGLSQVDGTELPVGSLLRLGYFRDAVTSAPLTDTQIQALGGNTTSLDAQFVEVASTTIGSGVGGSVAGHFAASSSVDTGSTGKNVAGAQIYLWALNSSTLANATQQAILYWTVADTTTNPDATPDAPGTRWSFPVQDPPGTTTVDLTDLSQGTGSLGSGAHLVAGTFPKDTSSTTGAANFGLANIVTTPSVNGGTQIAGGIDGVAYSLTLTASGGTPSYTWSLISGALPTGLTLGSDGMLSGTPTVAGTFNFTAQVQDSLAASSSKSLTIVIDLVAPFISTFSLPNGQEGAAYSQFFLAAGGSAPYTWSLVSGTLPTGITLTSSGALSGTPLASGTFNFSVQMSDAALVTRNKAYTLTLSASSLAISTPSPLTNAVASLAFTQALAASGGTSPYAWAVTSGSLPTGLSLSSAGLISGTLAKITGTSAVSTFTVQVTDGVGVKRSQSYSLTVLAKLPVPVVNAPVFTDTMVSAVFSYTLTASYYPKKFSVSGLPSGLTYVAATGVISGRPNAGGTYVVRISATNATGTSPVVSATLRIQALPVSAIGSFTAIASTDATVTGNLAGRVDVATTSTGTFSAKLQIGGTTRTTTGRLSTVVGQVPQLTASFSRGTTLPPIVLAMDCDDACTGTLTITTSGTPSSTAVTGWRAVWNASTNPAQVYSGYYSVGLDPVLTTPPAATDSIPQGTGFAAITVASSGAVTISGKTADGNAFACTSFLSQSGEFLAYQSLYSGKGATGGTMNVVPDAQSLFSGNVISGTLNWTKPADTSRTYGAGFTNLAIQAFGEYLAPNAKGTILGLPDTGSFSVNFAEGGIASTAKAPDLDDGTFFSDAFKITLPKAGGGDNPASLTLSINTANGAVSGGFTLVDGSLVRKVTYQGMIIRGGADSNARAYGYFLLPQIPTGSQTSKTSPILSGQMVIDD